MDVNDDLDEDGSHQIVDSDEALSSDEDIQESENSLDLDQASKEAIKDSSQIVAPHDRKWNRLRKHYHDQYLDIFKDTFQTRTAGSSSPGLPATQLGAVLWESEEKTRLYDALSRSGPRNLQALSDFVGSKSEVEIKAYLDSLREQEIDHQRFETQTKNILHAEIPAAIEIGPECEAILDQAADALSAFQEHFDFAAGQQSNELWLIESKLAAELDKKSEEKEKRRAEKGAPSTPDMDEESFTDRAFSFFHLSNFLLLSEHLFMNKGPDHPDSWHNIADEDQRPALTLDWVHQLYDLAVNFLQRLIKSCLFLAKSRLRAASSKDYAYTPRDLIRVEDVFAALDVLNLARDSRAYWIGLARKSGLQVVDVPHRKGVEKRTHIPYDKVEELLSIPGRSRSVSTTPKTPTRDLSSSSQPFEYSGSTEAEADSSTDFDEERDDSALEDENWQDDEPSSNSSRSDSELRDHSWSKETPADGMPSRQRRQILEGQQEEYMEKIDQQARLQEESRLLTLLGAEGKRKIKVEEMDDDVDVRPRHTRKSVEDCMGWSLTYEAEWEASAKRRRLDIVGELDHEHG